MDEARLASEVCGKKFGRLFVSGIAIYEYSDVPINKQFHLICKCDCGNVVLRTHGQVTRVLKSGIETSCGCAKIEIEEKKRLERENRKAEKSKRYKFTEPRCEEDFTGRKVNMLTVVEWHPWARVWVAECECGGTKLLRTPQLTGKGQTPYSCGCTRKPRTKK